MPSAIQLATQNEPYFLFYRTFLGFNAVVEKLEECSDKVLALDRSLHSTLLPMCHVNQQRRIAAALFEFISFSITREMKLHADMIKKKLYSSTKTIASARVANSTSPAAGGGVAAVVAVMMELLKSNGEESEPFERSRSLLQSASSPAGSVAFPIDDTERIVPASTRSAPEGFTSPPLSPLSASSPVIVAEVEHIADAAGSVKSNEESFHEGREKIASEMEPLDQELEPAVYSSESITSVFLPAYPGHSNDCPYTKARKRAEGGPAFPEGEERSTGFTPHGDFTSMDYLEAPESILKVCPVCGAQAWLLSVWMNLALFQQLNIISLAHLALAPLPVPQDLKSPSPREALTHVYHTAQRYFENALHGAMTVCQEVLLIERLSYPLPLLVAASRPQLGRLKKNSLDQSSTGESVIEIPGAEDVVAAEKMTSPYTHWTSNEDDHDKKMYGTIARLVYTCTHLSLHLLNQLPHLWPVFKLFQEGSPHAERQESTSLQLCEALRTEYMLGDILVVIRAHLLKAALFGFMDGHNGAVKAQCLLFNLAMTLSKWEQETLPLKKHARLLPLGSKEDRHGLGPADHIYHLAKTMWHDVETMKTWPWKNVKSMELPSVSLFQASDRDAVNEYFELKQIILLLTFFFELVEDKDDREEVSALEEYGKRNPHTPPTHVPPFSLKGIGTPPVVINYQTVMESGRDLYEMRRAEHYIRLGVAMDLLEHFVQPVICELTNSSNGGASARGRQLMGLTYLLKAEVIRFREEVHKIESNREEVERMINEANMQAVKQTESSREFLGLTMQEPSSSPSSPLSRGDPFQRKTDRDSEPKPSMAWRLLIPVNNEGGRDALVTREKKNIQGQEVLECTALLPPLWIRLWLVLCRTVFRSAASDMIFAKEHSNVCCPSSPRMSIAESIAAPPTVANAEVSGRARSRKKSKPSSGSPKMSKKDIESQKRMERCNRLRDSASLRLRYSPEEICFWYRWRLLLVDEVSKPQEEFQAGGVRAQGGRDTRIKNSASLFLALQNILRSFASNPGNGSNGSPPDHIQLQRHFFASLDVEYPLFSSAEEAFTALIKFGGSERMAPHSAAFAKNFQNASLFLSPSVSACTPGTAKQVSAYWGKLGFPPFPAESHAP